MEQKKSLWNSVFGRDDNQGNIIAALNEQGVSLSSASISQEEVESLGYHRMNRSEIEQFDGLLQYVPQVLAGNAYNQSVGKAFDAAVDGSFKVMLDPGTHLATLKSNPEMFLGSELSNSTNKVAGQAKWIKNDAVLNASKAPQIAMGVFNALSMATGQYFMSQINGNMLSIKSSVDRIERFLDVAQRSEFISAIEEMQDILAKSDFILNNPRQRETTTVQVNTIQRTAQKSIKFCQEQIKIELDNLRKQDKDEDITRKIDTIGKYLAQYLESVRLYSLATLLEVQIKQIDNPDEIKAYYHQMEKRISTFKTDFADCSLKVEKYLNENGTLNGRTKMQNAATLGTLGVSTVLSHYIGAGTGTAIRLALKVDGLFSGEQKKLKAKLRGRANELIDSIVDEKKIDEPLRLLSDYERMISAKVEIVRVNDEYYTNIPRYAAMPEPIDT